MLTQQQQTLIVELGYACGLSDTELLSISSLPPAHLSALVQSPLFHAEVALLRKRLSATQLNEAQALLEGEAIASIECLTDIRDNALINPSVRVRAADSILDRIEKTSKQHKVSHTLDVPMQFTDKQIQLLLSYMTHDTLAREAFDTATKLLPSQSEPEAIDCTATEIDSTAQCSEPISTPGSAHSEDSNCNPIASDDSFYTQDKVVEVSREAQSLANEMLNQALDEAYNQMQPSLDNVADDLRQFLSSGED